jgi:hypothetical protein
MKMFKKGDKISYTRTWGKGETVIGIFDSIQIDYHGTSVVWAYWGGHKSLTYVDAKCVKLVKAKTRNLPAWW